MALQDTCNTPSAADVLMRYMIDECGCPGVTPVDPVKFATLDVGSRSFNETRAEIEDPNAYGGVCLKSVSDGAEGSLPFTFSFCRNRKLVDSALGTKQKFFAGKVVAAAVDGIAPNILRHTSIDWWARGYRPGMVIEVAGFNTQTAFNGTKVILSISRTAPYDITFYTNADTTEYPAATANETDQTDISVDGVFITYQGNTQPNIIVEREFPGVVNESSTEGLFQNALGGVVASLSETFEPGQFVTGSADIQTPVFNNSNAASLGSLGQEDDCACGDKVLFDPDDGRQVELFYDGELICFTNLQWTLSRPNALQKSSCGKQTIGGKARATGTLTVPFTSSDFLQKVRTKYTAPLTILIWNDDRTEYEARVFFDVSLSSESVDPEDEAPLLQEVNFTANNDPDVTNTAVAVQRSFQAAMPPRNRVEFTMAVVTASDADKEFDVTGGDVGETITVDWGDGTVETTTRSSTDAETLSHTYSSDGTYTVIVWSDGDAPWTIFANGSGDVLSAPSLCYVREWIEEITLDMTGTSLVLDNYPALDSITIVSSTLTSLTFPNSRPSTVDLSDATAMTVAGYDAVLAALVEGGVLSGTADLSGGSAVPSTAGAANAAILTARGWTVTVNS